MPILSGGDYAQEVFVKSQHRAYEDMCSQSSEIDPSKTFETWVGPLGAQAPPWKLVMDAREYGDLMAKIYPNLSTDTPPRPVTGGPQNRIVDNGLSPLVVYSKIGSPAGDPDNTWDEEHVFSTVFAGESEINKGKLQAISINNVDPADARYEFRFEIQYQVPMPDLESLTQLHEFDDYQFDVDIRIGDGDWEDVAEVDSGGIRGLFSVNTEAIGSINDQITIRVQREKFLDDPSGGGTWDPSGNPKIFQVAWVGNCISGGPM